MLINNGRPIGARIREALEVLERIGPARAMEVCAHMEGVEANNAGKYCGRAVALSLATVDRTGTWPVYAVAQGWRELIDQPRPHIRRPRPEREHAARPFALQSAWSTSP